MNDERPITSEGAKQIGDQIGTDGTYLNFEAFRWGLDVENEHGLTDPQTDLNHDDPALTGKIPPAYSNGFSDYDERFEKMEANAEREWTERRKQKSTLIRGREARAH